MLYILLISCLLLGAPLAAQTTAGSVTGNVRDPHSAAIRGARVSLTSPDRGSKIGASTDESGNYNFFPVPPGRYRVTIEADGFQQKTVSDFQVDLDSRVRVDVELSLASVGQAVTVAASAPQVQRDSAARESVIENSQIVELPLDGRNILDLVYLSPGASKNVTNAGLGDFASNGNRPNGNSFLIDGVSSRDEIRGQSGFAGLSVDAVQQFKLKNSNATAEYGGAGTQVSVVVKNGTNQFHGSAFEFNRSTLAQARSFFSRDNTLPGFLRNQYGGSLSGPIRRNKTFFFVNYERQMVTSAAQSLYTIPTLPMRQGNFTGVHDSAGRLLTLTTPSALPWTPVSGQPVYSGPNMINPFYLGDSPQNPNRKNAAFANAILGYYEAPTGPGDLNNFSSARPTSTSGPQITARIDHQLTAAHSLAVRSTTARVTGISGTQAAYRLVDTTAREGTNGVASLTSVPRPTIVNEFRFGWNFQKEDDAVTPDRDLISELGIVMPVKLPESPLLKRIPTVTFAGNGAFFGMGYRPNIGGDAAPQIFENGSYTTSDSLTWQKGKHQLKTGYQRRLIPINYVQQGFPRGLLTFNGRNAVNSTGYSAADLLLGLPASSTLSLFPPEANIRVSEHSAFLQTDWRAHPRLTLNIGLRWEARRPPYDTHGQTGAFNGALGKIVLASPGGQISSRVYPELLNAYRSLIITATEVGWDENRLLSTNWLNLAPRFGFAYSLDSASEFVLRGAYGIFYSYPPYFVAQNSTSIPFGGSSGATSTTANLLSNENPFRLGIGARPAINGVDHDFKDAYNQQWNLALERVLFRQTTLSLAYVGNKGTHIMGQQQLNPGNLVYPGFGGVNEYISNFDSSYHAMQLELRQRYARGFSYQVNWTWAKSIDDLGGAVGNAAEDNQVRSLNLRLNRGNSDFSQRHVARANFLWQMPFGASWRPVTKALLGQWSLGGIAQWSTGVFATVLVQGVNFNGRPDVVPGVSWRLSDEDRESIAQKTGDRSYLDRSLRWYNPLAFAPVAVDQGRIGTAGRNIITGPSLFSFDSVLSKRFHVPGLPERVMGTVRIEAFNLFNHVNFFARSLNLNVNTATAGAFSQITGSPRQMQFGFRVDF
ncbi:MAG TPA: carboxypeptidase regulatory-like domain-containing protein [Bryobacteraceae bacterium]|nr:carboxypeptidase regulatory-like domain-containing protein [Bryobacteraceae bacterium]